MQLFKFLLTTDIEHFTLMTLHFHICQVKSKFSPPHACLKRDMIPSLICQCPEFLSVFGENVPH